MTYEHLKGIFERTGTIPIMGMYGSCYPKVCLNAALTIEKRGLTASFFKENRDWDVINDNEFLSFEAGWEDYSYCDGLDREEYDMAVRLRDELEPELI